MYVFEILVRAYFNQQLSVHVGIYTDQIHLQLIETLIFHDTETIKLMVYNIGVESFTDGWIRKQCDLTNRCPGVELS